MAETNTTPLKQLTINKHDIMTLLESIIRDPILLLQEGANSTYFELKEQENSEICQEADAVLNFFYEKWFDENESEAQQKKQVEKRLKQLQENTNANIASKIERILGFYKECYKAPYFKEDDKGLRALDVMGKAVKYESLLWSEINSIINSYFDCYSNSKKSIEKVSLLLLLEQDLDLLMADVQYNNEYSSSNFFVSIDKEGFQKHVMNNIVNNLKNHAFASESQCSKWIWEKIVRVSIEEDHDKYIVKIDNNGEPFHGDVNQIFSYGYHSGATGHTGYGLHSAKKFLQQQGGDMFFITSDTDFPVMYSLIIKK